MHPVHNLADALPKEDGRAQQHDQHRQEHPQRQELQQQEQQQQQHQEQQHQQHLPEQQHDQQHQQHAPASPDVGAFINGSDHVPHEGSSTPVRQNTTSSTTTVATAATLATNDTAVTPYSLDTSSPGFSAQAAAHAVFSARDGTDLGGQRRPTRRRTGPLSALQRERASLIRKMGACHDCKRRRVACHPSHHNTTWEGLTKKFGPNNSPTNGRLLSPALSNSRSNFTQDPQEMELDPPTMQQPSQTPVSNDPRIRTPLPSGPRPMTAGLASNLPGGETFRADLQGSVSRILANQFRNRYANVSVLLVRWEDDDDAQVKTAVRELANVFKDEYNYMVETKCIPTVTDASNGSWLWLSRQVTEFVSNNHQRDILKIFYYIGYSCIGSDRDTIISSSRKVDPTSSMAWQPIQLIFESICSDALIVMDCAYYPLPLRPRKEGMLELIAASAGEEYIELLGRSAFTRTLTSQLRTRAIQKFKEYFTASELHAKLLSEYPKMVQEQNPGKEIITRSPTPLMFQLSGNKLLPSIHLVPLHPTGEMPYTPDSPAGGATLSLTFSMSDDTFKMDSWAEWLRSMPPGIREVKVEGPHRNTFR